MNIRRATGNIGPELKFPLNYYEGEDVSKECVESALAQSSCYKSATKTKYLR